MPVNGEYSGRWQEIHAGSRVVVDGGEAFNLSHGFSLQAMVCPTTPNKGKQGLLTKWSDSDETGYALAISEDGDLSLWLGGEDGNTERISTGTEFEDSTWYFVAATYDADAGTVRLYQEPEPTGGQFASPKTLHPIDEFSATVERDVNVSAVSENDLPFVMAGYAMETDMEDSVVRGNYNGKIDSPCVAQQPLDIAEMKDLVDGSPPSGLVDTVVASWDFSKGITSDGICEYSKAVDVSPNNYHGEFLHVPARGVTGYNWTGEEHDFTKAPEQYGAVHFHDDDVGDAKWDTDFELTVPSDMESAAYAARLRTDNDETHLPFYVSPNPGNATADIAFLAPTASYLAYSNDHLQTDSAISELLSGQGNVMREEDIFLSEHREYGASLYDTHADGSGVFYSSRKRPILNMMPKYKHWLSSLPSTLWQYNADLHLIDWLEEKEYSYDVITDEDLQQHGVRLLESYNVILTGSHPEYYSSDMMESVEAYYQQGGRFMYMGANGFYWSIAFHPEDSQIIEIRRGVNGSQAWFSEPGELYHSFTGEKSGLWRDRGLSPQQLVGAGFIAEGFDRSSYYHRKPDSTEPEVEFIFDDVDKDEKIGDFGLIGNGAAGLELDIYDEERGTPPNAYLLASSEGHTDNYLHVVEEVFFNIPALSGSKDPEVRSDIVYFKTQNDGAVFSTSSIAWCGSLAHNDYENNVSIITENVLNRFKSEGSLP
ncbi:N,N-dimethylformamidase [halophilic archaeon]|nr:N,N-dimethylformamidase [halophilic archaeon]